MKHLNRAALRALAVGWHGAALCAFAGCAATGVDAASPIDAAARDAVQRAVLQGSSWQAADLRVEPDPLLRATASCRLFVGRHARMPEAGMVRVALDEGGKVLARTGDLTGLTRVLQQCVQADALTWAQTVAVYVNALAPQVVNGGDAIELGTLKAAGVADALPTLKPVDGGTELRFVMVLPASRYFRVMAFVPASGPTRVDTHPIQTR